MATGAILRGELAFVRIRCVAISASVVRHRFLEVTSLVTAIAFHGRVSTLQRETCAAVVEG